MSKKLFAVSDVHGHYSKMMQALADAGFDEKNEEHFFLSCGDLFDRGSENLLVYDFVRRLERKILIKGNHEQRLSEVLKQGYITQREIDNHTDITIKELLGQDAIHKDGSIDVTVYAEKIGEITAFLDAMLDYYETERLVFTHGWLPVAFEGRRPYVDPCWRDVPPEEWDIVRDYQWQQFYSVGATLCGKTIVCGHRPASMGYLFDPMRANDCPDPFYGDGMIAIDAWTVRSGLVNVLVAEEL
ncbi:MAG: metallophosphoesterase [Clostridia bacterium]|nr:metallophosphoesterase [Clostridia bacterium]